MVTRVQDRLWIFDFDGTLSRLVPDRERARLHPACRKLLEDLVALPRQQVAVLSSRSLEDLIPRVPVPGIFLGGGSGIEWQMPDGRRVMPEGEWEKRLDRVRGSLLIQLGRMTQLPGVELEDKKWSVALHTRKAPPESKEELYARVVAWKSLDTVRVFSGPEVLEIQLLPEVDKAFGVRTLCRMLHFDPSGGAVVYTGDDENDATAMRWVIYLGGVAFMVGNSFSVAGTRVVRDQIALAGEVRVMAGIAA
jgi:trehalose-phosphatase